MNNTDQYVVVILSSGINLYYKNRVLHREAGSAITTKKENAINNIDDTDGHLYEEVFDVENSDKINKDNIQPAMTRIIFNIARSMAANLYSSKNTTEHSYYYLEGKEYSKEEFMAIKLEKELSAEKNSTAIKKSKI